MAHSEQKRPGRQKSNSMSELRNRFAALRMKDDRPALEPPLGHRDHQTNSEESSPVSLTESVRHHWAPQFRPNSATTPASPKQAGYHAGPPQPPEPCFVRSKLRIQKLDADRVERKDSHLYPLSAFLTCPDLTDRYPSTSKFLDTAHTSLGNSDSKLINAPANPTDPELSAAWAVCTALDSKKPEPTSAQSAICMQEVELLCPQQPTQSPPSQCPPASSHPTLAMERLTPNPSNVQTYRPPVPRPTGQESTPSSVLPQVSEPLVQPLLGLQQTSSLPPHYIREGPQATFAQRIKALREHHNLCNSSASRLVRAPIPYPHLFIDAPKRQPPPAIPTNLFNKSHVDLILARQKASRRTLSPKAQKELDDFLERGHANPCWCSRHMKPASASRNTATVSCTTSMEGRYDTNEDDPAAASSDDSAADGNIDMYKVDTTPPTETPRSEFDELYDMMFESTKIEDDWTVVSPSARYRKLRSQSLPTSPVSDEDNELDMASYLPSPPLTPNRPKYTASDPGTDVSTPSPWILSPILSPSDSVQSP
ncbi:hypothetical protein N0V83_001756 [Neocucurbitaria cava]|uniref:Uncharacterized protein n=1 Tax=Neocucurbitaria cava TaxID=798079 RepID=A0A9W8YG73_9PLEO|nr:hypothetical protein N0V83_001756 [Neocucurbitaria cava]